MIRGRTLTSRPEPIAAETIAVDTPSQIPGERLLTSEEANAFLKRGRGFLEKRRSSGLDSPRFIQSVPKGRVRYRVADLIAWEDGHMRSHSREFA